MNEWSFGAWQALEAKKKAQLKRCYFDWDDWLGAHPNTPYTPIIPLLHGLQQSLDLMKAEGFDNVIARHARCCPWLSCREGLHARLFGTQIRLHMSLDLSAVHWATAGFHE